MSETKYYECPVCGLTYADENPQSLSATDIKFGTPISALIFGKRFGITGVDDEEVAIGDGLIRCIRCFYNNIIYDNPVMREIDK